MKLLFLILILLLLPTLSQGQEYLYNWATYNPLTGELIDTFNIIMEPLPDSLLGTYGCIKIFGDTWIGQFQLWGDSKPECGMSVIKESSLKYDLNNDGKENMDDLVYFIDWMYRGGLY